MTYKLGAQSLAHMAGVHPRMTGLVPLALSYSTVDFGCTEKQVRTKAEQRRKVEQGFSKSLNGPHVEKDDGFGHAVDLVPWIDGRFQWGDNQWRVKTRAGPVIEPFYEIAAAMQRAAIEKGVRIKWGAIWDRCLNDLPLGAKALKAAMEAYKVRHPGPDFVDGPHFELMR